MNKLVGVAVGLFAGWLAENVAADLLRDVGIPPKAARAAGAVIGALVA